MRALAVLLAIAVAAATMVVGPPAAEAAPPDQTPLITWNMQGASNGAKWRTVNDYIRSAEIVLLQEAGPTPPAGSELVAHIPWLRGPLAPRPSMWGVIQHHRWTPDRTTGPGYEVYFLQTDPATRDGQPTWAGGRVNLAIVTHRPADDVRVVRNPNPAGRPALGVRFGSDWYFTIHGLSSSSENGVGGVDSAALVDAIDEAVHEWGGGNHEWTVAGDFNRNPSQLAGQDQLPPTGRIYRTNLPTHESNSERSLGEIDYAVSSHGLGANYPVHRLSGAGSDHYPVGIGGMRAGAEPTDLRVTTKGDSITHGIQSSSGSGYRALLLAMLGGVTLLAKRSVDFVGSHGAGTPADPHHEGVPGNEIAEIAARSAASIPLHRPNVVTLHAGTNDMKNGTDVAGAPGRLDALIGQILADSPGVTVLVATLVPASDPTVQARIDTFNDEVRRLVARRRGAGERVALVEMDRVTTANLADGLHPNDSGYQKMAEAFRFGIVQAIHEGWITDPDTDCTDTAGRWLDRGQVAAGVGTNARNVHFADIDGDGRDDYLVVDDQRGAVQAWINDGGDTPDRAGWIPRGQIASGVDWGRHWPIFADIDGDGRDDYVRIDPATGALRAWRNIGGDRAGQPGWQELGQIASGTPHGGGQVVLANVDCDRRADYLVHQGDQGAVLAWLNRGGDSAAGPGWIERGQIASGVGAPAHQVRFADIDGDGRDDYLVVEPQGGAVRAYLNRGGDPA